MILDIMGKCFDGLLINDSKLHGETVSRVKKKKKPVIVPQRPDPLQQIRAHLHHQTRKVGSECSLWATS